VFRAPTGFTKSSKLVQPHRPNEEERLGYRMLSAIGRSSLHIDESTVPSPAKVERGIKPSLSGEGQTSETTSRRAVRGAPFPPGGPVASRPGGSSAEEGAGRWSA